SRSCIARSASSVFITSIAFAIGFPERDEADSFVDAAERVPMAAIAARRPPRIDGCGSRQVIVGEAQQRVAPQRATRRPVGMGRLQDRPGFRRDADARGLALAAANRRIYHAGDVVLRERFAIQRELRRSQPAVAL